jgi:hypothetical protein
MARMNGILMTEDLQQLCSEHYKYMEKWVQSGNCMQYVRTEDESLLKEEKGSQYANTSVMVYYLLSKAVKWTQLTSTEVESLRSIIQYYERATEELNAAAHRVTKHSLQLLPRKFQGPLSNPAKTANLTEFTEYQDASRSVKKFLNLLNQYDIWNGTDTYPQVNKWEYAKLQHAILTVSTESGGTIRDLLCRHILSSGQHMSDKLKDMEIRNLHSNFLSILPSESHLLKTLIYERRLPSTAERVSSETESINHVEEQHLHLDTYLETIVQIIFQQCRIAMAFESTRLLYDLRRSRNALT